MNDADGVRTHLRPQSSILAITLSYTEKKKKKKKRLLFMYDFRNEKLNESKKKNE